MNNPIIFAGCVRQRRQPQLPVSPFARYDATVGVTAVGTGVSEWQDISGNMRHLSQSNAAIRPTTGGTLNGKPVITFNSAGTLRLVSQSQASEWNFLSNADSTVFCVANSTNFNGVTLSTDNFATSGVQIVFGLYNGVWRVFRRAENDSSVTNSDSVNNGSALSSAVGVVRVSGAGENATVFRINKGSQQSGATGFDTVVANATTSLVLAGGIAAEIVIYDRALQAEEIDDGMSFLMNKWGFS